MNKLHVLALAALVSMPAAFAVKAPSLWKRIAALRGRTAAVNNEKGIVDKTLDYVALPTQVVCATSLRDIYNPFVSFTLSDIPGVDALFKAPVRDESNKVLDGTGGALYTKFNAPIATVLMGFGVYKLYKNRKAVATSIKNAANKVCRCSR